MSKFPSKLEVELADQQAAQGRGTWRLTSTFSYESDVANQTFTVPAGFVTDFASVPRIPIFFMLVGDVASEAAVIHDYLYSVQSTSRAVADKVLKEAAKVAGCPNWQAQILYLGVRLGGWYIWDRKKK